MSPLVSVIVPVYNNAKYLKQCLDSLVLQTLQDIEIICVNDGSTDNSLEILNNYALKDSRITVITQQNQGQSAARNRGIEIATGEYIGFLDSDDWADIQMFEKLYNNAQTYQSDIVMCSITTFDENTNTYSTNDSYMTLNIFPKTFENRAFSVQETFDFIFRICVSPYKLFRKNFLNQNNITFVEGLIFEDNVFCIETLLKSSKISIVKENLAFYRITSSTSTTHSNKNDKKKLDIFKIFELEEKLLKETNNWDTLKDYFIAHKRTSLFYWLKKVNSKKTQYIYLFHLLFNNTIFLLYPLFAIYNKFSINKSIQKLKGKKIILWGASQFLKKHLKQFEQNTDIIAVVDSMQFENYDKFEGYKLIPPQDLKNYKFDYLIPTIPNIYNFDKMVELYLKDYKIKAEVINIFKLTKNMV